MSRREAPRRTPLAGPRLSALGWSGVEAFARQGLSLVFWFVLVALVTPHDVGVFLLAVALVAVPGVVLDAPLGEALIQRPVAGPEEWDTGFTANLLLGAGVCLLSLLLAGILARLLREPALAGAVPALGGAALLGAIGNIQRAALARAMRFRAIASVALVGWLAAGLTGIALAAAGLGTWALVANVAVGALVTAPLYWWLSDRRPRLRIHRASLVSLAPFALHVAALRSVVLLRDQSPVLILGLLAGPVQVAFLGLGLRLARAVGELAETCTSDPLLAVMSREQADRAAAGRLLLDILVLLGTVALPAFVGLALTGPWLISAVFGPEWAPAGALLPWLCAIVAGWLMLHVVAVALRAQGAVRSALAVTAPAIVLDVAILALLAPRGIEWALAGMVLRLLLTLPVLGWALSRRLAVPVGALLLRSAVPLGAAALMGVAVHLLGQQVGSDALRVAAAVLVGGLIYLGAIAAGALALGQHPLIALRRIG